MTPDNHPQTKHSSFLPDARKVRLYRDILILALLAIPLGLAVGAVDALFGRVLLQITDFRMDHPFMLIPFLGIAGLFIIWIYKKIGGESIKGMTLLFEAGHGTSETIPLRLVPLVIIGTWLTHLFGGSAGREGVAVQIGGTLGHYVGRRLHIEKAGKILLVAGMAAGFGGLFRTPIAATFFALEVLTTGELIYDALLPSLVGAFTASYTSGLLGLGKFTVELTSSVNVDASLIIDLAIMGLAFGITGGLFAAILGKLKKVFANLMPDAYRRIFIIGVLVSLFSLLCFQGRYSGLGTNLISTSFTGVLGANGIYPFDFALKLIFTVVTLAAGFQGGEVTPLFSIGASLGVVLGSLMGLPLELTAALGYAAVFGGATNTLLAPMLIGTEVFGFSYLPYFFVVCVIAYIFNGNACIYSLQKGRD